MRAIMQWERRDPSAPVVTLHGVTMPVMYHRDYFFRAVHATSASTATLYCFANKADAKNKSLTLPGPALGTGTITLGTANQIVSMTPTAYPPDITGMAVSVSSTAETGPAWSEGWSFTANFGYHVTDELLLWFANELDQASAGMPFENWSFSLAPDELVPARFPHLVGSFIDLDPIAAASRMFMLSATVQFRAYVIGETSRTYAACSDTIAQVRSIILDDYRKTPVAPWGRIYHDIEPAGVEEPARMEAGDFRGFAALARFRVMLEAAAHAG